MPRQTDWNELDQRLRRVTTYLHEHLEEEIDLNRLAMPHRGSCMEIGKTFDQLGASS